MRQKLLNVLRCPSCTEELDLTEMDVSGDEVITGILHCSKDHFFPVVRSIPRMLPSSINEYWPLISEKLVEPISEPIKRLVESEKLKSENENYDTRTRANFSYEWENHEIGDKTWGMELNDRVEWFFLNPIRIPKEELKGKLMLDAGCGNGSQSVAYTEFDLEVVAIDLSSGLEKGYEFSRKYRQGKQDRVHFVQGDLQRPPFATGVFDIIHTAGVLQATPDTEQTFRAIRPLLRPGGTFYTWLIGYEKFVTPIVESMRIVTTRIPPSMFVILAGLMAHPFNGFCYVVDKLGIRQYPRKTRRESILALHDIFGAPYAYSHSYEEVAEWYKDSGFDDMWECNVGRRGFGICGRLPSDKPI